MSVEGFEKNDYIHDHGHIFVPYLILNCFGILFGTIGKIKKIHNN